MHHSALDIHYKTFLTKYSISCCLLKRTKDMVSRVSVVSSCMLLSVFFAMASSSADYGYAPTPDLQKQSPQDKPLPTNAGYDGKPNPEVKDKPVAPTNPGYDGKPYPQEKDKPVAPTNPGYDVKPNPEVKDKLVASTSPGYDSKPFLELKDKPVAPTNSGYDGKPYPEMKDKPVGPKNSGYDGKPYSEEKDKPVAPTNSGHDGKPYSEEKDKPIVPDNQSYGEEPKAEEKLEEILDTTIAVQGLVLCKSGSQYFPIQGALARVICLAVDEKGYETAPFSILSPKTDSKGYFVATVSPSELEENWKITECRCFLENSSLEGCNIATDVNNGISGALLSKYRSLDDQLKLYSVGPFFYTTESKMPVSNGY